MLLTPVVQVLENMVGQAGTQAVMVCVWVCVWVGVRPSVCLCVCVCVCVCVHIWRWYSREPSVDTHAHADQEIKLSYTLTPRSFHHTAHERWVRARPAELCVQEPDLPRAPAQRPPPLLLHSSPALAYPRTGMSFPCFSLLISCFLCEFPAFLL